MRQAIEALQKEWAEIRLLDGSAMEAYVARPGGQGPWPAVLVFMEIFGVNSHIREVTERIAAEGYVAIAPNYYHRTTPNLELGYDAEGIAEGRRHKDKTTREGLLGDIRATIQFLQEDKGVGSKEKMACIGFCFGGHVAYIAAAFDEIAATASFYGGGIAVSSPGGGAPTISHTDEINGEVLCLFGDRDEAIPKEQTDAVDRALSEAGVRHEVIRYPGVGHGFFCNQRKDFDAQASEDAWRRVKALFARNLK
jgi:carboxymethylenebutenolidase